MKAGFIYISAGFRLTLFPSLGHVETWEKGVHWEWGGGGGCGIGIVRRGLPV